MNSLLIKRLSSANNKRYPSNNSSRLRTREIASQYFLKAKNKQHQDKPLEALDFYLKATIYDSDYFQAFCNMGSCYRSLGKYPQSKNCYLRALKINPVDAISHYNLANLYRIISDYEQSIEHYNFIIEQQQNKQQQLGDLYVNSLINVGICYKNLGLYEKAITIYERVNEIAPNEEVGYFNNAMNILSLIQQNTAKRVNKFDVELANRATMLFNKVLDLNPANLMVKIAILKLKVMIDRSSEAVNKVLQQLKLYEKQSGFDKLQEELQETLKFVQSFKINLAALKQPSSQPQIVSSPTLFNAFEHQPDSYEQTTFLTEQQGIKLIKEGELTQLQTQLAKAKDSLMKGVLELALNLEKAQRSSKYIDKAYQTYLKYFVSPQTQQCIPFERISSAGHRFIGKLLNLRNQFKQASLHFQYSSNQLKRNASSSAIAHNDIAEGLQAAGSMKQAIDEYLLAFQLQPRNQKISYNLGCCLFENGRYDEALQYFNIFMQTLQDNAELDATEKELWQTQCLILIALANSEKKQALKSYLLAYDRLKQLRMKAGQPQLQQQHLFCFFQHLTTLLEQEFSTQQPQLSLDQLQQLLIDVYSQLLCFSGCQDREVITVNLGNLCYESKRYLKAIQHFLQIKTSVIIPYQKIALCYLRLIEPQMTLKYIELECSINKKSSRVLFMKDLIEWVYYNQNQGTYNKQLPAVRQDLFYQRNHYAITLIDHFQTEIKETKIEFHHNVTPLIDQLFEKPPKLKFAADFQNNKYTKISSLLHKYPARQPSNNTIPQQILQICFGSSNQQVSQQLHKLLHFASNLPNQGYSMTLIQTLLHVFIYCNQKQIHTIKNQLSKQLKLNRKVIDINMEGINHSDDYLSIKPDFDCLKKLVLLLVEWQQVLAAKTDQIIAIVQSIYYRTNIAKSLEMEYHFPRHSYTADSDQTFYKLAFIVMKVLRMDIKLNSKGSKLPEIKKELISQFQYKFNHQLKSIKLKPIYLNDQFIPVTLTAYHPTKAESELFIEEVLKMAGRTSFIAVNCDYYSVVINKLVRIICKWGDPFSNQTISSEIINKILQNPIYIANQSVIALLKLLPALSLSSREAHKFIQQDTTLQF